ncbi:hypothetical protein Efla_007312 [Eimeria flavescens]
MLAFTLTGQTPLRRKLVPGIPARAYVMLRGNTGLARCWMLTMKYARRVEGQFFFRSPASHYAMRLLLGEFEIIGSLSWAFNPEWLKCKRHFRRFEQVTHNVPKLF